MLGMYFAMLVVTSLGLADVFGALPAILIAAGLSVPVFFVFGWLLHAGLISLIEKSGHGMTESEIHQTQLIMTLGISLVAANGGLMLFGSTPVSINTALSSSAWMLAPFGGTDILVFLNQARVIAAIVAVLATFGLYLLLNRTMLGRKLRARRIIRWPQPIWASMSNARIASRSASASASPRSPA